MPTGTGIPASIPAMALASGDRFAGAPAVLDDGRTTSFEDLSEAMLSTARALIAAGVQPRDRVALWAPNSAAWITAALGVMATGA